MTAPSVHDTALDIVAAVMRERSINMVGVAKPWNEIGDSAKDRWRSEAAPYLEALATAGVALFRRHH